MARKSSSLASSLVEFSPALMRDTIAAQLVGRDREAEIIALALVAREHALLVGPPGTGKSMICRIAAQIIAEARYCERLLSPTTPPEAVWGPISLSALRLDRYEHVTAGYAADAHILYLDEVGRASPAILDSLLHLLGPERQALIGTANIKAPLVAAIGSANTWPEDAAMLDRWTMRATIAYLPAGMRRALLTFRAPELSTIGTLADLDAAFQKSRALNVSSEAYDTLDVILGDLDDAGIAVSDRRLRAGERIARAAAVLRGGDDVQPIDLEPLQYVLWTTPDQAAVAGSKIVARANPLGARLDAILGEADEVVRSATDSPTRLAAATKLKALSEETKRIVDGGAANGRAAKVHAFIKREGLRVNGIILGMNAEQIEKMIAASK